MKVCYIIMPFENSEYLIRCVNSLYRQRNGAFEVILAENNFGDESEKIEKFISEMVQLKRISKIPKRRMDKLVEAKGLISDECSYVQFLDVDTVVSPSAAKSILECESSDLIIPVVAVQKEDDFVIEPSDKLTIQKKIDECVPQRFCYGRKLFDEFDINYIDEQGWFSVFLLSVFAEKRVVSFVNEVCMYIAAFVPKPGENLDFNETKEQCSIVFSKLFMLDHIEAQIVMFGKLISRVSAFLENEEMKIRWEAFAELQKFGSQIQEQILFRKFFENQIGMGLNDFLGLNYEEYDVYKTYITGRKNSIVTATVTEAPIIEDIKSALETLEKEFTIIKTKFIFPIHNVSGITDPVTEVPQLYREGKLGLKIIIKSFGGWLKYKFSRKK
ncbi:MAG: glycosyltransferase family 2 protein [Lachnospiraceae bacterium]|nr:glycosyltransferase family 2 protein [Lachnospiraceae bacterium]